MPVAGSRALRRHPKASRLYLIRLRQHLGLRTKLFGVLLNQTEAMTSVIKAFQTIFAF